MLNDVNIKAHTCGLCSRQHKCEPLNKHPSPLISNLNCPFKLNGLTLKIGNKDVQ